MIHAFRLGPVSPGPPASFAYAATVPGGKLAIQLAPADAPGLAALREAVKGQPLACEPALAEAAGLQGLEVAPLPPEALALRAGLAYELASGIDHGASRPEAIAALLAAAGAFWSSRAWELIAPEEALHVTFSVGRAVVQGELSVQADDPTQPRLVLCDEPAALARLEGLAGGARVTRLVEGGGLLVELAREPAWAGSAIEAAFKLPRVPMPERRRAGRAAPIATQDLVLAAALLRSVVAFADLGADGEAEAEVEAAMLRVRARVGPTPLDPGRFQATEGLTRVGAGGDPGPAAAPAPEDDEAPLSPAELAALLKGGAAPAPVPGPAPPSAADASPAAAPDEPPAPEPGAAPAPSEDDERPLSPAELAALLKGEAAPPPPAPAPSESASSAPAPSESRPPAPAPPESTPAPPPAESALDAAVLTAVELTPVRPADPPPPASPASPAAPAPPEARPATAQPAGGAGEGWLSKAWRALGGSLHREGRPAEAAPEGPKPAAKPAVRPPPGPSSKPVARAAPPPRPEPPADPEGPFAAFARALRIPIPAEPPPATPAEREALAALARQVVAGAAEGERFVSFPAVALQIIELVHRPDADARGVAGFISRDPGLAADVLAVANSAAFRGVSGAGSVREAVARLGLQEVGRVASAVSARALLVPAQAGGAAPSTRLFTRAVAVATAASATALRLPGAHSDQVWLAGLLHDVGLALGAAALQRLARGGGAPTPVLLAERALEQAHVEVGAAALAAWGLPRYLAEVCGRHHDEAIPAGPDHVDLHLVRLTSALARLQEPEVAARAAREIAQSAGALGLDAHAVRALAADLRAAEQRAAVLVR